MKQGKRNHLADLSAKWLVFMIGLLVMSFGIVLMIKADVGSAPWDVFHIGLYKQFGLSIGTWSIIAGFFILLIASLLSKAWPKLGAFLNMLLVGIFIDLIMLLPFLKTPNSLLEQYLMLVIGILVIGYGIGLYISARCGAGPRDSLMLVLTQRTGWKVQYIRGAIEVVVLTLGFLLDGPVFVGTIVFCITIGPIVSFTLPQCEKLVDKILAPRYIDTPLSNEVGVGD
ncbi:putative membrane protein YczE [Bacillus mesophilus]|uniref:YitT family protein n=1 Tax=Bacillus mesophilus TaxID=1808955 RepID=A0A6M0Q5U7_9BACI|nr:YitT family protein [Bacillus mesophilus]MBM7660708.1 putative membrane protein YczE [Bacillus mesophilus]NEY71746.1 YitT family protein [Bacillus mesophilus]